MPWSTAPRAPGARRPSTSRAQAGSPQPWPVRRSRRTWSTSRSWGDLVPYGYYRAKVDAEGVIERSNGPATIVRATQFHSLAAFLARTLAFAPVGVTVGDLRLAPVDIEWVASRLADHAEGRPPEGRRSAELAGPGTLGVPDLAAALAAHDARRPARFLRLPPVGPLRAVSAGALLPSGTAERGGRTFEEWLANQPHPLPRGRHDRT